jgi:hypothetical protein
MAQICFSNYTSVSQDCVKMTKIVSRNRISVGEAAVMCIVEEERIVVGCPVAADTGYQPGWVPLMNYYYIRTAQSFV